MVRTQEGPKIDDVEVGHDVVKAAWQAPGPPAQDARSTAVSLLK